MEESWEVWGGAKGEMKVEKESFWEYVSAKCMTQEKLEKLELVEGLETAVGAF